MEVIYSPELLTYMDARRKHNISIEVAASNTSDIEVTELFLRLVNDDFAAYLEKKNYRSIRTEVGLVLLPPYRLHVDPVIRLNCRKRWLFHSLSVEGVRL